MDDINDRTGFFDTANINHYYRKVDYLEQKLYNAFYAFEALTKRGSSQLVCGICGVIPDMTFGKEGCHKRTKGKLRDKYQ